MYWPALLLSRGSVVFYPLTALLIALGYLGAQKLARHKS